MKSPRSSATVVRYELPQDWIRYDIAAVSLELLAAKAAMLALKEIPYQRSWADDLQKIQLKREVAGTSRIEGAEFTERELDAAMRETPRDLETRSQRQAAAAHATYQWIATLPGDRPLDADLIREVHRRIVTGCDDDHCAPGELRKRDENVTFGTPRHRGVEGGADCTSAFGQMCEALRTRFPEHDPLVQALAIHYHFAAMHPFLDGNGRTARAVEALLLQRTGLRDTLFIAMSNYYYEEKVAYLSALAEARSKGHGLTPFLRFGLRGIESQCRLLLSEIRFHVKKALFRNTATELFGRLSSPRKRVMSARHIHLLNLLLDKQREETTEPEFDRLTRHMYKVQNQKKALIRDLNYLFGLGALKVERRADGALLISADLDWPTQITETEFFRRVKAMPKGKVHGFLSS